MAEELDLEQLQDLVGRIDALLKGERADMIWQALAAMSAHTIHHFRTSTSEKEALATYMTAVKQYLAEYRLQGIERKQPDKPPVLQCSATSMQAIAPYAKNMCRSKPESMTVNVSSVGFARILKRALTS